MRELTRQLAYLRSVVHSLVRPQVDRKFKIRLDTTTKSVIVFRLSYEKTERAAFAVTTDEVIYSPTPTLKRLASHIAEHLVQGCVRKDVLPYRRN